MKIGIIADIHASYTSSIMPIYQEGSKYTTRLQMCIDSIKWSQNLFNSKNVAFVVNLGDLFDNTVVRSEELTAVSEAYSTSNITEFYLLGNHETLDVNRKFYSTAMLDRENVNTVTQPSRITINGIDISFIPYMKYGEIDHKLLKSISSDIVFTHIDIKGSSLRQDYTAEFGVEPELLSMYFKHVFNGHIHTAERLLPEKGYDIRNVGSLTSTSFADSNEYIPSAHIYDTETGVFESYQNPYAILFRRIKVNSITELYNKLEMFKNQFRYIIRAVVPYDIREECSKIINDVPNIITSRVVSDISSQELHKLNNNNKEMMKIVSRDNLKVEFLNFLKSDYEKIGSKEVLKYPYNKYLEVMSELDSKSEEVK